MPLIEDNPSPLGFGFEDHHTRKELELLDDLQKMGIARYINLPQLVVVGEQSAGKSSVLQAVTEIPFPIKDTLCTRFAIEIVLQRTLPDETTKVGVSIIPDPQEKPERKQTLEAWHPREFTPDMSLDKEAMESILSEATEVIFGNTNIGGSPRRHRTLEAKNRLSNTTLRISRSGSNETNFAIVGLPGLVPGPDSDPEHATSLYLVDKYMSNPRSIIVAVIDVVNLARHQIIPMLSKLPDAESRVIGIINKCDTKQKQSDSWVFDLIRDGQADSTTPLKEGWFGLRNRQASERDITDEKRDKLEAEFFSSEEWQSLDRDKLGRHNLKKAFINMRNNHVKKTIPELLIDIENKFNECVSRISELGEPRTTNHQQFTLINKIAMRYWRMAESALDGNYKDLLSDRIRGRKRIRDDLDVFLSNMQANGLTRPFRTSIKDGEAVGRQLQENWPQAFLDIPTYSWIYNTIKSYRGTEFGGEVNSAVRHDLWERQTVHWETIATTALRKAELTVDDINTALFEEVCSDRDLRTKLLRWLQNDYLKASENAKKELQTLLENERECRLFTLRLDYSADLAKYREARIASVTEEAGKHIPGANLPQAPSLPSNINPLPAHQLVNAIIYDNIELAGILNTHDSLAAYYNIALYRFIDNVAQQVIERHLLGPSGPLLIFNPVYVNDKLNGEQNATELNNLASEDPEKALKRRELEAERASLEESRVRVQNFRLL